MSHSLVPRLVCALLSLCAAVSLTADPYHPDIVQSQVVSLDVKTIEANANSGTPFELALGSVDLKVVLAPAPLWGDEGVKVMELGDDGKITTRTVTANYTFAGEVVGEDPDQSEVRITIAQGVLEGYVLSSTGWWFLEPLSQFDPKAGADQYLVYATGDLDFVLDYGDDGLNEEVKDYDRTFEPAPDKRIPVVMVADQQYINRSGSLPYEARHYSLLNMINGIYLRQTGREFRLHVSIGDFHNQFLTSTTGAVLNEQMRRFIDFMGGGASDPNGLGMLGMRSLVGHQFALAHLTTAKDLVGNAYGYTPTTLRFSLSQQTISPSGGSVALTFQNMMVAAHEIGHTFGAIHPDAECICVDDGLFGCDDYQRTLMWPEFFHDNQPRFSDKNRQTVRDTMTRLQV